MKSRETSPHLSRFGIYNDTSRGWCFIGEEGFRGSLIACENELEGYEQIYPDNKYRIAQHSPECRMQTSGECCTPRDSVGKTRT